MFTLLAKRKELSPPAWPIAYAFATALVFTAWGASGAIVKPATKLTAYPDGRPAAAYRLEAKDRGPVLRHGDGPKWCDYLGARDVWVWEHAGTMRTLGIARSKDLNAAWHIDPKPIVPVSEQIENTSLHYEAARRTWWLFTNHVGLRDGLEYTDAIWVYWTTDLNRWNPAHKAAVLDGRKCMWSRHIIGLPSVVRADKRLAIFYDGNGADKMPTGVKSHMNRDVGLAWLELPLEAPSTE